jgi:DNA-binding NarL/FixJ family response regulator
VLTGRIAESKSNDLAREGGLQVVLVDDSVPIRERLAASVRAIQGVSGIRQADDVPSGLRLLETGRTDVVVLDFELPGQSGLDFLMLARGGGCAALIIMFSVHDHPRLRQKCADLGADFFFNKLTEFQQVAEVCRDLSSRRAQQAG